MNNKFLLKFDWYTFLVYFALVAIGLINIYSIGHTQDESMLSLNHTFGKQLFFGLLSIGLIFFLQFPKVKVYERYSSIFYLIILALLIGLFVFGKEVSGAKSWYSIAGFSFQPAEFSKVITALALTKHLSEINTDLTTLSDQLTSFVLIFLPALIILPQPDPGSTVVSSVFFWFYTQKNSLSIFLSCIGLIVLFILTLLIGYTIATAIVLGLGLVYIIGLDRKKRRKRLLSTLLTLVLASSFIQSVDFVFENVFEQRHRDRFNIVLGREVDTQGIGYNINQSQIAIGSGGILGKGFLRVHKPKEFCS